MHIGTYSMLGRVMEQGDELGSGEAIDSRYVREAFNGVGDAHR